MELRLNHGNQAVDATRYYTFGGRTVAMRTTTGVRFLASDHHGTALLAIDAASGALTRRRTAPFGTIRGDAPQQWPGDKGFVGGTQDGTTGLTHLGAREYDPTVGRFISVDPLVEPSDPQQLQGYSYANNNPVTLSDPTGLRPDDGGSGRRGGNQSSYHNIALFWMRLMAYWYLQVMQGMRGEITTDLGKGGKTRNTIPRAHKSGDNKRPGVADMIFWGEDVVYVWEVKPNTLDELNKGRVQLNRYIQKLQDKLRAAGDHRRVRPGPWLPPGRGLPVGNGKVLDVWSDHRRPGMLIYGSRSAPKHSPPPNGPRPVPVPEPKLREVPVPGQPAQPRTLPQPHAHPNGPYGTCPGPGCARPSDGYLEDRWHWDPPNVSAQEVAGGVGTVAAVVACLILCLLNPAMA
jgi:RHS repeat-associated protein